MIWRIEDFALIHTHFHTTRAITVVGSATDDDDSKLPFLKTAVFPSFIPTILGMR